jgi:branched-chain amino acid transport system ATP-binding protein
MSLAKLININKEFGGLQAITQLNFSLNENEILGLIGPNGAGKTTVFNLMSGVYPASNGEIYFKNKNITKLKAHAIAQLGLTRTFQQTVFWSGMTVLDHVALGGFSISQVKVWEPLIAREKYLKKKKLLSDYCLEILEMLGLEEYRNEVPDNLSYGHQKLLGIGIALANKPKLLLLDEPAAGLNPSETDKLVIVLEKILQQGISIVLVEHDMKLVMSVCHRIVVINFGVKLAEGTPYEISNNEDVIKAYLGD